MNSIDGHGDLVTYRVPAKQDRVLIMVDIDTPPQLPSTLREFEGETRRFISGFVVPSLFVRSRRRVSPPWGTGTRRWWEPGVRLR